MAASRFPSHSNRYKFSPKLRRFPYRCGDFLRSHGNYIVDIHSEHFLVGESVSRRLIIDQREDHVVCNLVLVMVIIIKEGETRLPGAMGMFVSLTGCYAIARPASSATGPIGPWVAECLLHGGAGRGARRSEAGSGGAGRSGEVRASRGVVGAVRCHVVGRDSESCQCSRRSQGKQQ